MGRVAAGVGPIVAQPRDNVAVECAVEGLQHGKRFLDAAFSGHFRAYEGIPLMPTFHPAYLLRSSNEKKVTWADLQKVITLLGRKPQRAP